MELRGVEAVWSRIAATTREAGRRVLATDGDGTLWTGDVGEDLYHAFLLRGAVTAEAAAVMRSEARDHGVSDAGEGPDVARRLLGEYVDGRFPEERMCEIMSWCFAGWTRGAVEAFAREAVDGAGLQARLHGEVVEILSRARAAGLELFLVSASPVAVIAAAGALAGFDAEHLVAARSVYRGDVMAAAVERPIPYGAGKVVRLRERIGPDATLCAALGDNAFDVPLLSSARIGVAVRPKPRLRARAGEVPLGLVELAAAPSS